LWLMKTSGRIVVHDPVVVHNDNGFHAFFNSRITFFNSKKAITLNGRRSKG